jgi:hypothetical protein
MWSWGPRHGARGGEPSGVERRPVGRGLGRLAVLLVDRGMEKPSMT